MSINLSDVKGVGKKEDTLKEAGIDSVEKLADSNIDDLTALKGIGNTTAEKMIENAKSLIKEISEDDSSESSIEIPNEVEEELLQEELKRLEEKKDNNLRYPL